MQKARHQPALTHRPLTACRHVVSGSLSSPLGVLLIFRSRYLFAIGHRVVFSLGRWASRIRTYFHVSGLTQVPDGITPLRLRDYHPLWSDIPVAFGSVHDPSCPVLQPRKDIPHGLGSSAFARRYLRNRGFFLFLRVLRCFSSPRWRPAPMHSVQVCSGTPASTPV